MTPRPCLTVLACLALAACNNAEPAPPADPSAGEAEEIQDDKASIIRPDIEIARTAEVAPLDVTLAFGDSGTALSAEAVTALSELLESPQITEFTGTITLRGHSDAGGNDAVNMRLSKERADAVAQWLTDNGIPEDRITVIGFGEQNPLEPNALPDGEPNEAGRAANRRVDVNVAVPAGATIPAPAEPVSPAAGSENTGSLLRPAKAS